MTKIQMIPNNIQRILQDTDFLYEGKDNGNEVYIFAHFNEDDAYDVKRIYFQEQDAEAKEQGLIMMWTDWLDEYLETKYVQTSEPWWSDFKEQLFKA